MYCGVMRRYSIVKLCGGIVLWSYVTVLYRSDGIVELCDGIVRLGNGRVLWSYVMV